VAVADALHDVRAGADAAGSPALAAAVASFTRALLAPVVAAVGWDAAPGEEPNAPLLRALVLRLAAMAGSAPVVAEALRRFDAHAAGAPGGGIPADLRQLVYNTAAAEGGRGRWEALRGLLGRATLSEEQRRLMTALGRASEPALLDAALGMMLDGTVRSQDAVFLIGAVGSNPGAAGPEAAWAFLKREWDALSGKLATANFLWAGVVGGAISSLATRAAYDDVAAWFGAGAGGHPTGSAERKVRQSLEAIRSRVWRAHMLAGEAGLAEAAEALARGA
jgi:hypothetical protein